MAESDLIPPLWLTLALAALGGVVGFADLFADRLWQTWSDPQWHAVRTGPYALWIVLISIQPALWFVSLIPLARVLRTLAQYGSGAWRRIALLALEFAVLIAVGIVASNHLVHLPDYLPAHREKLAAISVLGGLFGLAAAVGVWLTQEKLRGMEAAPITDGSVTDVLETRDTLQNLFLFLGAIVGLAILGAAGERGAIAAYSDLSERKDPGSFPKEYVLTYGIYFSLLLALVYVPVHLKLRAVGHRLREHYFELPSPTDSKWADVCAKRKTFDELLALNIGPAANFKAGLAILTPLIGSLTGLLLGR
ncbi:MAG TPA: hypothetical protein VF101_02300 [Gaiellaceae bacterium]